MLIDEQLLSWLGVENIAWFATTDPPWYWLVIVTVRLWLQIGFYMILFLAGLQRISPELYEAAAVDGARNAWQTFRYITFPQLRANSVAVLLLLLINAYQAFDEFFNLLDNSSFARPLLVYLSAVTFIPSFIIVSQLRWVDTYRGIIVPGLFSGFPRRVGGGPREGIVNGRARRAGKGGLVSTGSGDEERAWAADKRDFVADRRDEVADERDGVADTRDRTADDREAELDKWKRHLDARAAELGGPAEESGASAQRAEARAGRSQARLNRDEAQAKRTIAAADRDESTKRRQADAPPTRLAMVFADIAEQLYDADSFDDVLSRIAEAAVSTIAGCRMASVTLVERSGYRTGASTDPAAMAVDEAQYQLHEGPCLDAVDAPMVYAQSFPDERWPTLASRPTESGVQSALSYRLAAATSGTADSGGGSLNSYGVIPNAFNDTAQEIGLILAAHASVAARAVDERSTLQSLGRDLQQALLSRDVIGQAKGILMERLKITPEDAFDLLRRSSQHLNVKLRDVARGLAETGEFRMTRTSRPADQQ